MQNMSQSGTSMSYIAMILVKDENAEALVVLKLVIEEMLTRMDYGFGKKES